MALEIKDGKVQLQRADGTKVQVDLEKFADADQATLRKQFGVEGADKVDASAPPQGEPATDLPHPLGKTTGELKCGEFNYYLYLPKSLVKGARHPIIFVMNPGGGGPGTTTRYEAGAERNRWIIAVSKESRNDFDDSGDAVDAMIAEVRKTLPIDGARMYASGMSGGSRMAYQTATKHKEIAGVIGCGAGGSLGSAKQISYGLCGTNCYNRTDMANSFKAFESKDNLLRFFPGKHDWAESPLIDDAITHLNGVFLIANRRKYPDPFAYYLQQLTGIIQQTRTAEPMRAYMWSSFLNDRKALPAELANTHKELGTNATVALYVKGLSKINEFAQEQFGATVGSQSKIDPKVSQACKKEAGKYEGTSWKHILELMSEDAQSF